MLRGLILLAALTALAGCDNSKECIEACGKAHHESVTKCESMKGDAKAKCETSVDEVHEKCEAACKK